MFKPVTSNLHFRETLVLAWPLVLTQVGQIITGMVDNIFLGRIGATEQAAGILSNNLYVLLLVFIIGVSYATTPLVTSAQQQQDLKKKASLFKNSLFLNFSVAVVCFLILFFSSGALGQMKQPEEVVKLAVPFFDVIILSMIPVSLYFTCKQYCEGLGNTRMALWIGLIGNLLNIILNYAFIYGKMGFPEMGYMGSAWASFWARLFMGVSFLFLIFKSAFTREISSVYRQVKINFDDLKNLWRIGFNSALQFTFEVAAFVIAGLMAGSFGKEQIDAHGIALSLAAFTYMFGSGIASSATIRVGVYNAQNNWNEIRQATNAAVKLVMVIMGSAGLLFALFNKYLPLAFSHEPQIVALAADLLIIAAMFQLFDGLQVTLLGVLRGLEDVRVSTVVTLVGYWVIALPLAYFLAFTCKMETIGIWIGLLASLVFVAMGLYWRFRYLVRKHLGKETKH